MRRAGAMTDHGGFVKNPVANRNVLYLVIGALALVAAVLAYQLYKERKQPEGVQINIGPGGIKIEKR